MRLDVRFQKPAVEGLRPGLAIIRGFQVMQAGTEVAVNKGCAERKSWACRDDFALVPVSVDAKSRLDYSDIDSIGVLRQEVGDAERPHNCAAG